MEVGRGREGGRKGGGEGGREEGRETGRESSVERKEGKKKGRREKEGEEKKGDHSVIDEVVNNMTPPNTQHASSLPPWLGPLLWTGRGCPTPFEGWGTGSRHSWEGVGEGGRR